MLLNKELSLQKLIVKLNLRSIKPSITFHIETKLFTN